MQHTTALLEADPFDLPEWLGVEEVVWEALEGLRSGHLVPGRLTGPGHDAVECDLLGVDQAYPSPVTDDAGRSRAHQVWQHGQVLLARYEDRLVLAVPGTGFDADLALDALGRLALAVGADPCRYSLRLRIGSDRRR